MGDADCLKTALGEEFIHHLRCNRLAHFHFNDVDFLSVQLSDLRPAFGKGPTIRHQNLF